MMLIRRRFEQLGIAAMLALAAMGCATPNARLAERIQFDARWTRVADGIVRADTSTPTLALVFTGGEHGEGTEHILNVLGERGVRASFFVTGDFLAIDAYRALVRRMAAEGHYVGPHSHGHLLYCPWEERARSLIGQQEFSDDLLRNIFELRSAGMPLYDGPTYFIPPYEWYNADQVRWANAMGLVLFSFSPGSGSHRDWIPERDARFVSSEQLAAEILDFEAREPNGLNGFILLLHLGSQRADKMHRRLARLVDELARRGYRFVRIDELLAT